MYHKTFDAGKKIYIGVNSLAEFKALKKEFGPQFKQFLFGCWWQMTGKEATELLKLAEV